MTSQQRHLEDEKLVIGASTSVLFDMQEADAVFTEQGSQAYIDYMVERADEPLKPGPAFAFLKDFNSIENHELVVCSRNNPITAVRAMRTFAEHDFVPFRYMFTNGAPIAPYMHAYNMDQFISTNRLDVQAATDLGIGASLFAHMDKSHVKIREALELAAKNAVPVTAPSSPLSSLTYKMNNAARQHHVFDFDGVLAGFSAEDFYQQNGLSAYQQREKELLDSPLEPGNMHGLFSKLLRMNAHAGSGSEPYKVSIVTARGDYAAIRAVNTLVSWKLSINGEMHCVSGGNKRDVFEAMQKAHPLPGIYYDDTAKHVDAARQSGFAAGQILPCSPR